MHTINSISGGKTSAYIAVKYPADYEIFSLVCIDDLLCKPKDKTLVDYVNRKLSKYTAEYGEFIATAEDDKTLYALMDLEQILGKEIIWVRGQSFDDIINKKGYGRLPSWARRYCTAEMKIMPIFYWWFYNIGEICEMRIGFRMDEFKRMERFFNNSNPTITKIPILSKNYGLKRQVHKEFKWRYCSFPLLQNNVTKKNIDDYWKNNSYIPANLFEKERNIQFPIISNCVGCFHKKAETLAVVSETNPNKMKWFSEQEKKGKGTWHDSKIPYEFIINNSKSIAKELLYEVTELGESCDSGGCEP